MPLIVSSDSKNFEPLPIGVVQAVCSLVVDIGTHKGEYKGVETFRKQLVIIWELNAQMERGDNAGKNFTCTKFYTASLDTKATLRKDLESWRGKPFTDEELRGFDLEILLGVNCMLNICESKKQDGSTTQKIGAIMPMIKGLTKMDSTIKEIPKWVQKKKEQAIDYSGPKTVDNDGAPIVANPEDDLPF